MSTTATQAEKTWDYQNDRALIVPYVPSSPSQVFREEFLSGLYIQTKNDGLLRRAFPGVSSFSMNWFIHYFYTRTMLIGIEKPGKVTGYSWIYEVEGNEKFKKGSVGVCYFRSYFGTPVIQDLSFLGLAWYFQELGLNVIYGTVALWNRVSVRFAELMGFEDCGIVPDFFLKTDSSTDTHIMALRRERFFEVFSRWKHSED